MWTTTLSLLAALLLGGASALKCAHCDDTRSCARIAERDHRFCEDVDDQCYVLTNARGQVHKMACGKYSCSTLKELHGRDEDECAKCDDSNLCNNRLVDPAVPGLPAAGGGGSQVGGGGSQMGGGGGSQMGGGGGSQNRDRGSGGGGSQVGGGGSQVGGGGSQAGGGGRRDSGEDDDWPYTDHHKTHREVDADEDVFKRLNERGVEYCYKCRGEACRRRSQLERQRCSDRRRETCYAVVDEETGHTKEMGCTHYTCVLLRGYVDKHKCHKCDGDMCNREYWSRAGRGRGGRARRADFFDLDF